MVAGMGPFFAVIILVAGNQAAPFEDMRGRFALDLPPSWSFAPQPGEVSGASFQRVFNGVPATFSVQVMEVGAMTTLDAFVAAVAAGVSQGSGYELVDEGHGQLAGLSILRRRYTVTTKGWGQHTKMAEDWYAVHGGKGYVVHMESAVETFKALEYDFGFLRNSLRFAGVDPLAPSPHPASLTGRWLMLGTDDTVFDLKADGTFDLAGTPGVWRVKGNDLLTRPLGGGSEIFQWRLIDGELVLSGASLDQPIRYRRFGWQQPSLQAVPEPSLLGRWVAKGHALELSADNAVILDGRTGTYVEADGMLIMRLGKKRDRVVVEFKLDGDRLTLARDQFGKGVVFRRQ